uniref:Uncharacterized protein n=1 Tax=Lactuca sativa TaxID=4236 RepID=A0A9R1UWY8_LACSA|nr:hypothetical protein LSAT_V11C800399100 [Lactuca sativa]
MVVISELINVIICIKLLSKSFKICFTINITIFYMSPLFRKGIDAPVLLILRDKRHKDFQNSILAMAETNIANGPIYFNCYPNFSVGLFDKNILDTLVLTIETKNLEFKNVIRAKKSFLGWLCMIYLLQIYLILV